MSRLEATVVAEEVYRRLKRLIVEGELPPGARIDRRSLAQELGVSPTPLNDALARLIGERFVERRTGRREEEGLYVPERPEGELVHIFAVRAGLEGMAGRLAVERVAAGGDPAPLKALSARFRGLEPPFDEEKTRRYLAEDKLFHEGIIAAAGNPVLADIDQNLGCVHRSWIQGLVRPPEETLGEHRDIIEAFEALDADRVQGLLVDHNLRSRDALLRKRPSDRAAARP